MAKIHNGFVNKQLSNTLKETDLNNFDLATTRIYKGVKPMWKQLGFQSDDSDNPNNNTYWQNVIPDSFDYFNLSGVYKNQVDVDEDIGVSTGAKTPRQSYFEVVIDEEDNQVWDDNYYYPVLPKLDKYGVFKHDVNVTGSYGLDTAPIANVNEVDQKLILDIDFTTQTTDNLLDKTDFNVIDYNQDFQLSLDDDLRLHIDTLLLPAGPERDKSEQAF